MYKTANGNPCEVEPGTPVKDKDVPTWFRDRMLKAFGPTSNWSYQDGLGLLWCWFPHYCPSHYWLDHYGSAMVDGVEAFVTEPYYTLDCDITELHRFAEMIDCKLIVDKESYWYPGKTIRLAFVPKAESSNDAIPYSDVLKADGANV